MQPGYHVARRLATDAQDCAPHAPDELAPPGQDGRIGGVVIKAIVLAVVLFLSAGCDGPRACDAGYREAAAWLDANALAQESVAVDGVAGRCFGDRAVQSLPSTTDARELLRAVEAGQPDYVLAISGVVWDGAAVQPWFLERYRPVQAWLPGEARAAALTLFAYSSSPFDAGAVTTPPASFASDALNLRAYRIGRSRVGPDDPVHLTLLWDDVPGRRYGEYRVDVRLVEAATGETWANSSVRLAPLGLALDDDARLAQQVLLDPPDDLPRGDFRILVVLTEASGRSVELSDDAVASDGGMVLATVVNPPDVSDRPIAMGRAAAYAFEAVAGDARIALLGYEAPDRVAPGEWVRVALLWSASAPVAEDYHVLVHVVSSSGEIVAQGDGVPVYGFYPTNTWAAGTFVRDEHGFMLPEDLPRGDYRIYVGLYLVGSGERLVPLDASGTKLPDGRVLLHTLAVR